MVFSDGESERISDKGCYEESCGLSKQRLDGASLSEMKRR